MRSYINTILENSYFSDEEFKRFSKEISLKIKDLPSNPQTFDALQEIEDLLKRTGAGDRKLSSVEAEIGTINDPELQSKKGDTIRKLLARFIFSIDMSRAERDEFFELWRKGELINVPLLLSKDKPHTLDQIVNGYSSNRGIKAVTDELLKQTAYGRGKGEYFLTTFSNQINHPAKGDVMIGNKRIEIKTADIGGARFFDRDVKPDAGWYGKVSKFFEKFRNLINYVDVPKSGLSFKHLITIRDYAASINRHRALDTALIHILNDLYDDKVSEIIAALNAGNANLCTQLAAEATFKKYIEVKGDDGVLFINLAAESPLFFFFNSIDDLTKAGLKMIAKHGYPVTQHASYAYPQITIGYINTPSVEPNVSINQQPAQEPQPQGQVQPDPTATAPKTPTPSPAPTVATPQPATPIVDPEQVQLDRLKQLSAINIPT